MVHSLLSILMIAVAAAHHAVLASHLYLVLFMNNEAVNYMVLFWNSENIALEIWDNIKSYVTHTLKKPKSQVPSNQSFQHLVEFQRDILIPAKLHFFVHVPKILKPFLEKYQTEKPMVPYLTIDLHTLLLNVMKKLISSSAIYSANTIYKLSKIDVNDKENLKPWKEIDIGFSAKQARNRQKHLHSRWRDFKENVWNSFKEL